MHALCRVIVSGNMEDPRSLLGNKTMVLEVSPLGLRLSTLLGSYHRSSSLQEMRDQASFSLRSLLNYLFVLENRC